VKKGGDNRIKRLGILFLISIPLSANAQFFPGHGEDSIRVTPNIAPYRTIAKLALFSPLEQKNSIRLSVEVTLNSRLSIEPEIGIIYHNSVDGDQLNTKMINSEARLGIRYYFPEKFITGLYTGPLLTFATDNYGTGIIRNFHPSKPDSAFYDFTNPAQYQENDYGLFWIAGLQPVISRHINFDISGGVGYLAAQTITKYDPYAIFSTKLPSSSIVYKFQGLISLKFGYIF